MSTTSIIISGQIYIYSEWGDPEKRGLASSPQRTKLLPSMAGTAVLQEPTLRRAQRRAQRRAHLEEREWPVLIIAQLSAAPVIGNVQKTGQAVASGSAEMGRDLPAEKKNIVHKYFSRPAAQRSVLTDLTQLETPHPAEPISPCLPRKVPENTRRWMSSRQGGFEWRDWTSRICKGIITYGRIRRQQGGGV
ncbi:hypothetical protein I7I51_04603 [Histoplasma capsulatum]|uniref:Uncharacterized protein n=1 Tax=Ajellomyces capsulatus TaxID=5037 RepID=A0A8A1M6J3_AJECA|nr:hypothetical protein I7I51_04603 [Histoplasma capsulatum]